MDQILNSSDSDIELIDEETEERPYVYLQRVEVTDPARFRERFRLTPRLFELLLQIVGPKLELRRQNAKALTPQQQLMCALRFYASNGYYYNNGDANDLNISNFKHHFV